MGRETNAKERARSRLDLLGMPKTGRKGSIFKNKPKIRILHAFQSAIGGQGRRLRHHGVPSSSREQCTATIELQSGYCIHLRRRWHRKLTAHGGLGPQRHPVHQKSRPLHFLPNTVCPALLQPLAELVVTAVAQGMHRDVLHALVCVPPALPPPARLLPFLSRKLSSLCSPPFPPPAFHPQTMTKRQR